MFVVGVLLCFVLFTVSVSASLVFPSGTVLQITFAISWPIEVPDRKLYMNNGFQFNYNVATSPTTFYKPAFFPYDGRSLLGNIEDAMFGHSDGNITDSTISERAAAERLSLTKTASAVDKYLQRYRRQIAANGGPQCDRNEHDECDSMETATSQPPSQTPNLQPDASRLSDMSAGELYRSFEDILHDAGVHRSCVEKSVCQMARHPLHVPAAGHDDSSENDDQDDEDLMAELLHFVMTPSVHQSFQHHEHLERSRYEEAEMAGHRGEDCDRIYSECDVSVLDSLTYLDDGYYESEVFGNKVDVK